MLLIQLICASFDKFYKKQNREPKEADCKPVSKLTHIGNIYDDSSSKKGKKEALNVLIKVPKISPTYTQVYYNAYHYS